MTEVPLEHRISSRDLEAYLLAKGYQVTRRLHMSVVHRSPGIGAIVRPTRRGVAVTGTIPTWRGLLRYLMPWRWYEWRECEHDVAKQIARDLSNL